MGSTLGAENYYPSKQPPQSTQPGYPSVDKRSEYQPTGVNDLLLEVKSGMASVWWQIEL